MISTTPWDSYLIKTGIWTYPPNVILGPTLFRIPAEEFLFFVIQTYITSLLYLLLSKPTFHPAYLCGRRPSRGRSQRETLRWLGTGAIAASILCGVLLISQGSHGLYLGLIITWAGPFVLLLWYVMQSIETVN